MVDIIGFSMYFPGEKAIYVPVNHEDYLTGNKLINQMTKEQIAPILKKLTAKIIMHNAQFVALDLMLEHLLFIISL